MAKKEKDGGSANKKVIIIAIVAVLVIAIAAGAAVFVLTSGQEKPEEIYLYSVGEAFTTNLKDNNTLVKVSVTLAHNKKGAETELDANSAVVRNAIVFVLRSKTKEQMNQDDVESVLSNEIIQRLNSELGVDYFVKAYFSDLVVQG